MSNQVEIVYSQSTPTTVELVAPGPQGPTGPAGAAGPAGVGSAWQQGAGAPGVGVGSNGDFYLNTTNGDIYGPKAAGAWGSTIFNIAQGQAGPQGPAGPAGAAGQNGREVQLQVGATHIQWRYVGDPTWINLVALSAITGPAGPAGAQGPAGSAGPSGVANATAPITYDAGTQTVAITPATTAAAGSMSAADKTKLDSVTVDRASLTVVSVRNNSGTLIPKGAAVYVTGSSGTTVTVALADASAEATAANTLGVAFEAIASNANGLVVTEGELTGLNTSALTEGALLWLSETTGGLSTTRPTQPAHGVVMGWCIKQGAGTSGIIYVRVDNGQELDELHDVLISSPATGQVLRRAPDGLWKNQTLTAADIGGLGTDSVPEGSVNLYFMQARARQAISVSGSLSYDSATGVIGYTAPTLATVATSGAYGDLSGRPTLGTAAATDATAYATAAQGAKADTAVQPAALSGYVTTGDSRLTDAREWSAATIDQAEAETGTATTRRAFTAQRVFQAIAAWWAGSAAKTKLDGIATGATANSTDAQLRDRATHTGTQAASTITGLAAVATTGAYSDLTGRPTLGTAAALNSGTSAGNVVVLDGSARLPAVDGSQLTGLPPGGVTSIGLVAPAGFSVSGSPITTSGSITLSFATGYSLPTTASQANWDTAHSERLRWDGGSTGLDAATARTSLGLAAVASSGSASDLSTGTLAATRLPNTAVTPGSYTNASVTVDAAGRITAASSGTATGIDPVVSSMIF